MFAHRPIPARVTVAMTVRVTVAMTVRVTRGHDYNYHHTVTVTVTTTVTMSTACIASASGMVTPAVTNNPSCDHQQPQL